jgi:hypothetical protein
MAEDEAFFSRKGENSKPLSLEERGLERGFPNPLKSKVSSPARNFYSGSQKSI